jgi:hypothetical protein
MEENEMNNADAAKTAVPGEAEMLKLLAQRAQGTPVTYEFPTCKPDLW